MEYYHTSKGIEKVDLGMNMIGREGVGISHIRLSKFVVVAI